MSETDHARPSTPALIGDAIKQASALFSAEVQLAKLEIGEKIAIAVAALIGIVVAGVFSIVALIFLLAGLVELIAKVLPVFAACFIVGGAILFVAIIAIVVAGLSLSGLSLKPERTIRQVKSTGAMMKGTGE